MDAVQEALPGRYRLGHVAKSEVLKILTLPSTAISSSLTATVGLLVTGLVSNTVLRHTPGYYLGFDPTKSSLSGLWVAGLAAGVFGALLITGEYSSGTISATIAATPRRPILLAAKIGVAAAMTLVFSELLSFAPTNILENSIMATAKPGTSRC
jgi:ABC-2 type transport system permease protein